MSSIKKRFALLFSIALIAAGLMTTVSVGATPTTVLQLYQIGTGSSCTGTQTLITTTQPLLTPGQCYYWFLGASDLSGHDHMKLTVGNASYWTNITWFQDIDGFNICTSGSLWKDCNGGAGNRMVTSIGLRAVVNPNISNNPVPPPDMVQGFGEDLPSGPYRQTVSRTYNP